MAEIQMSSVERSIERDKLHVLADKLYVAQFNGDKKTVYACLKGMEQIVKRSKV